MKRKLLIILGICLILIVAIGFASLWFFGEDNNSTGEKITVVHNDSIFHFYSITSIPNNEGYAYAVIVNGTEYFLSDSLAEKLNASGMIQSFSSFYDLERLYNYGGISALNGISYANFTYNHPFVIQMNLSETKRIGDANFECDSDFSFEYRIGEIGSWDNERIITKIFNADGTELQ